MREYKEPIPHIYIDIANGNRQLFKRYVAAYIRRNYPNHELIRIENKGTIAVIRQTSS